MLYRIEDWMPEPPRAVVEADEAIAAAHERLADVEDATYERMREILAKRKEIAQPWDGSEREKWLNRHTYGARKRVEQAEAALGRAAMEHAAEWAPLIEEDIELIADGALKQAEHLLESLNQLARLRALLDDVQDTPAGLRYFLPRVRNGMRLRTTIAADHHGVVYEWLRDLVNDATPEGRRQLEQRLNPPARMRVVAAVPADGETVRADEVGSW